jgi:hypothetical protein
MRRKAITALLAVMTIGTLAAGAAGAADDGMVGIRALPNASSPDDKRAYISAVAARGSTIVRKVAVSNNTDEPLVIQLYVGAAERKDDDFVFGEPGEENDVTRWSRVSPGELTIPPGQEMAATVKIRVPDKAASGDHAAVVWAELPGREVSGVNVVNRVGVRIYLTVDPIAAAPADPPSSSLWLIVLVMVIALGITAVLIVRRAQRRPAAAY